MKRHYYLIIFLLLTVASCREKPLIINKFIYFRVYGLVYDSLDNPNLGLYPYFEYKKGLKTKIAYGIHKSRASVEFPNGLDSFYVLETDMKTVEMINKTLCNINYDSTYNGYEDARCSYFIYETSDNKKRIITFGKGGNLPNELKKLLHYIENLWYPTNKLLPSESFRVDSMVIDFEKKLFIKHPPPPKPEGIYLDEHL